MSIDYYVCVHCGEPFSDAGHFVCCDNCGTMWCSDECAEADGYTEDGCGYCREEIFTDRELLGMALFLLGYDRDELIKEFKQTKGE